MKKQLHPIHAAISAASLAALLAFSPAHAVPCGTYSSVGGIRTGSTDLGTSATTCRSGGANDASDSLADLNDGAFFGATDWTQLTRTVDDTVGDAEFWSFSNSTIPNKTANGTFSLTAGLWDLYSQLVVVLKDGGSTTNGTIKWSAYLLPTDVYGAYSWSYDNRKTLGHATLYGVLGGTTSVPEPAALALLVIGLAGITVALRQKRARQATSSAS